MGGVSTDLEQVHSVRFRLPQFRSDRQSINSTLAGFPIAYKVHNFNANKPGVESGLALLFRWISDFFDSTGRSEPIPSAVFDTSTSLHRAKCRPSSIHEAATDAGIDRENRRHDEADPRYPKAGSPSGGAT